MDEDAGELWPSIDVSRYCFEDEVVEDEGVAALELLNPNFFNFDFCFDAIATLGQSLNGIPKKKKNWIQSGTSPNFSSSKYHHFLSLSSSCIIYIASSTSSFVYQENVG